MISGYSGVSVAVQLTFGKKHVLVNQLSLRDVVALKAALPGSKKSSRLEWLKRCHHQLHGDSCQWHL
jgi:hypothetical protein